MKTSFCKYVLVVIAAFLSAMSLAQPRVTASIEQKDSVIMIGDRFFLCIEVDKDQMQTVVFPSFRNIEVREKAGQELPSLEIIREWPVDTLAREGRRQVLRKKYELSAFDEGRYNLGCPQVLYADKNIVDTLFVKDSIIVEIATFQIDSLGQGICDIHPQKTLGFRFGEISGYLLYVLLGLLALALIVYLFSLYLKSRGRSITDLFRPAPPVPPHVAAIAALEALRSQRLCQNNKHKQYYSALSEILRTYISGRFGVGAMEMTTDQLMKAVEDVEMPSHSRMDLQTVLMDSDLVKFAKFTPEDDQNDSDFGKSYGFVEDTKPVEEIPEDGEENTEKKS